MAAWIEKKGPEGLVQYRATRNRASIDGLPGLVRASTGCPRRRAGCRATALR